ncbi:uncharacterized protein LOC119099638 [Pollicipes pollicipes]|uniref:uncharacterized protein LOC119099638 n=1 Tax=Pollicipes pollicipes TaxID=41117 RepID=UPI001884B975|nr:uncharacterized protein LOC119099638 [Pollicipes pollicipes]
MQDMVQKPWMDERLQNLAVCTDAESFLQTLAIQDKYFHSNEANLTRPVIDCLKSCPDRCSAFKVTLLSLGSKSIGSNYGISLTISPEVESVTEQFDYTFLNMVAELSASISFLLGLSAIAIYDWLIAFGVWAAVKLGIKKCGGHKDDESTSTASPEAPTPPIPPVLRVPSHIEVRQAAAVHRQRGAIGSDCRLLARIGNSCEAQVSETVQRRWGEPAGPLGFRRETQ